MARGHSEIVFTLTEIRIATYNILTDTFGTPIELPQPQDFEVDPQADTDEIKAQGYLQHLLTVNTHATFTTSSAGLPFEALAIMAGLTNDSSGSSPNQERTLDVDAGSDGLPYFAIVGKMVGEQDDDLHIGLPVCKLDSVPSWSVEQNQFVISEMSGRVIKRENGQMIYFLGHETAAAIDFDEIFA